MVSSRTAETFNEIDDDVQHTVIEGLPSHSRYYLACLFKIIVPSQLELDRQNTTTPQSDSVQLRTPAIVAGCMEC